MIIYVTFLMEKSLQGDNDQKHVMTHAMKNKLFVIGEQQQNMTKGGIKITQTSFLILFILYDTIQELIDLFNKNH